MNSQYLSIAGRSGRPRTRTSSARSPLAFRRPRILAFELLEDRRLLSGGTGEASLGDLLCTFHNPFGSTSDLFGQSMAAVGNDVLVGAPWAEAAYLFSGADGGLLRTFHKPTPGTSAWFGYSVAACGNKIVVGAPYDDTDAADAGAVYLFDAATGDLLRTLHNPTPEKDDRFGFAVAALGDDVLASAPWDDFPGAPDGGTVYLLDSATGELFRDWRNPAPLAGDEFGACMAVEGNRVVVGAPWDYMREDEALRAGAAFLFDASSNDLQQAFFKPPPYVNDWFGTSVSLSGNQVYVGAPFDSTDADEAGIVHVFNATTAEPLKTFSNPTPAKKDWFGRSMAVVGNNIVVSAHMDSSAHMGSTIMFYAGAAYLLDGATGQPLWTFLDPTPTVNGHFGTPVAVVGNNVAIGRFGGTEAFLFAATLTVSVARSP